MASVQQINKLEENILSQKKDDLVILITRFNGLELKGIFSTMRNAKQYATRFCINHITINHNQLHNLPAVDYGYKYKAAYEELQFEFLHTDHLSKSDPIYILHSKDYKIYGNPEDYLTNDKTAWIYRMQQTVHDETSSAYVFNIDPELELVGF